MIPLIARVIPMIKIGSSNLIDTVTGERTYIYQERISGRIVLSRASWSLVRHDCKRTQRHSDLKPAWIRINELFEKHGLPHPPVRLRDELVSHMVEYDRRTEQGAEG